MWSANGQNIESQPFTTSAYKALAAIEEMEASMTLVNSH